MARRYSSFLIRTWGFENGKQRIEIEHIQSGECTRTASLDAAIAWLEAHQDGPRDPTQLAEVPDDSPLGRPRNA